MPAFSTHYLFAREVIPGLGGAFSDLHLNEDAFYVGTQGPDIFFFHRILPVQPGKSRRQVGSVLHRTRPSRMLDAMIDYVRQTQDRDVALSYLLGFLAHYALDRVAHPYVYGLQDRLQTRNPHLAGFTIHNIIEFSLDNVMLNRLLGVEAPYQFDTAATLCADGAVIGEIGRILDYTIAAATEEAVTQAEIETAVRDMKTMQRLLLDTGGGKEQLLRLLEHVLTPVLKGFRLSVMMRPKDLAHSMRYANEEHRPWRNPNLPEVTRHDSFYDLFEQSKGEYRTLCAGVRACLEYGGSTSELTQELSFLTGVPVEE